MRRRSRWRQPFRGEEPFLNILADHLMMQMNADYDWNLFFRMLFTLEPGSNLEDFSNLLYMVRDRFCMEEIYEPLREFWSEEQIENFKQWAARAAGAPARRGRHDPDHLRGDVRHHRRAPADGRPGYRRHAARRKLHPLALYALEAVSFALSAAARR